MMPQQEALALIIDSNSIDLFKQYDQKKFFTDVPEMVEFIKSSIETCDRLPTNEEMHLAFPKDVSGPYYPKHWPVWESYDSTGISETYVRDRLEKDYIFRQFAEIFGVGKEMSYELPMSSWYRFITESEEKLRVAIENLPSLTANQSTRTTQEVLNSMVETTLHPELKARQFYATGINCLDGAIKGFNKEDDYVIVAARMGVGKSMLLCMLAASFLKQGLKVAFYTGEMKKEPVIERIISNMRHFALGDIYYDDWKDTSREDYVAYLQEGFPADRFFIYSPDDDFGGELATPEQLGKLCEQVGADVLLIDQASHLKDGNPLPSGKTKAEWERHASISRQVKRVKDKYNILVVMANQLGKSAAGAQEADTAQLAGSDEYARDATKVIIMLATSDEEKVKLSVSKNRTGAQPSFYLYKDFNHARFKESLCENPNQFKPEYQPEGEYIFQ